MTEEYIIAGCLHSEPAAQRELYNRYSPKMLSVCYRFAQSREDAEDMLQEGFIKVFTQIHTFQNKGAFEGWIRRIIVHTCINFLKKYKKFNESVDLDHAGFVHVREETVPSIMQAKQVSECIRALPMGYRTVLNLYALEGFSHREIANMLDIEESTSRSQYTRAKGMLENILIGKTLLKACRTFFVAGRGKEVIKVFSQMQKNFKQDSLEEFLQNQLQNHRMYPKDTVWREIRLKLHGEKRWPALTIAAVMLIGITTAICLHFSSRQNIFSIKPALQPNTTAMAIAHNKPATGSQGFSLSLNDNAPAFDDNVNNIQTAVNSNNDNNKSTNELITSATTPGEENEIFINDELNHLIVENNKTIITSESPSELRNYKSAIEIIPGASVASAGLKLAIAQSATMQNDIKNATPAEIDDANNSLIDKFKELRKPGKFSMMLYAAPSISYRKLVEDNTAIKSANEVARSSAPSFSNNRDVNDAVRHKPSSGIEAGVSILYDFTKKFRLKGGLQFNMRQYSIDAYKSNTELSSIALVDDNGVDTINTFSLYRNYGNNSSAELMNRYYQVSVPVGIEWEVFGNKRFQFNVAGSIQPTYLLNRNAYMLTTNFKNYAENEDLVRKWNINSNIEAFITMNIGEFKWQLGPQIRYQPYSTFIGKYPIKEHLIDYGIKLGFSTRLR